MAVGFIPYYGGKGRMCSRILNEIIKIPHTSFCEPFCGSACITFNKPHPSSVNKDFSTEIINDTSDFLINFYRF